MQMQIGMQLGKSQAIRHTVGLHTPLIRAIEIILREEKFSFNKFGVINGGPDWPTSVFCGILGLKPLPILLWTLPTITIVVPAVIAGATVGEKGPWETVNAITAIMALLFQGTFGFLALRAVSAVTDKHKDELSKQKPELQDLVDLDKLEEEQTRKLAARTQWRDLPRLPRVLMGITASVSVSVAFFLGLAKSRCIREFQLGADYTKPLGSGGLNSDARNLLLPWGTYAIMTLPLAGVSNMLFWAWVSRNVEHMPNHPPWVAGDVQMTVSIPIPMEAAPWDEPEDEKGQMSKADSLQELPPSEIDGMVAAA